MVECTLFEPEANDDADQPPAPPCATWSDVTFMQWMTMHLRSRTNTATRIHVDGQFAKRSSTAVYSQYDLNKFHSTHIAGRSPSSHRQTLPFYGKIDGNCRSSMKGFLNYIISYGECIENDTAATAVVCLKSRHSEESPYELGPTWGAHETFECGTW